MKRVLTKSEKIHKLKVARQQIQRLQKKQDEIFDGVMKVLRITDETEGLYIFDYLYNKYSSARNALDWVENTKKK